MTLPWLIYPFLIDGHLCCSQGLASQNKGAIKLYDAFCEHVFLSCLLNKCLGMQLLGHRVDDYLTSLKLPNGFPKWLYHFTFPELWLLHILVSTCYCQSCHFAQSSKYIMKSHSYNFFITLITIGVEYLIIYLLTICKSSFMQCPGTFPFF